MGERIDHTYEVEKRVIAIRIKARDSCGFFEVREDAFAPLRECFFCRHGKFDEKQDAANPSGYCRFKK